MGNCQAIDAATLVVQHPDGKEEKLYWPVCASEVMKTNPGHYVALLISTTFYPPNTNGNISADQCSNTTATNNANPVRLTRIKLLRPTDTLALGHVYRLITTQEVMQGMWAKKHAKMRKSQSEQAVNQPETVPKRSDQNNNQVRKQERHRHQRTTTSTNSSAARPRTWQPALQSISEAAS